MERGEAIEHKWVTKAIENAQRKVEGRNFDIRKQLLEYDDVANDQRKEIYSLRSDLMSAEEIEDQITAIRDDVLTDLIDLYIPPQSLDELWDIPGLEAALSEQFGQQLTLQHWLDEDHSLHEESLRERIRDALLAEYARKETSTGPEIMRHFEKAVMLQVLDQIWKEHLSSMDYLRQGIHLRGFAQKNPKQEYKREAFEMFSTLTQRLKQEVIGVLSKIEVRAEADVAAVEEQRRSSAPMNMIHDEAGLPGPADEPPGRQLPDTHEADEHSPFVRRGRKIGRNEPCPCGSGKKYKQCHGKVK